MMKNFYILLLAVGCAASVAYGQNNEKLLQEGFTVDAVAIGDPAHDGVSGSITNTGGSDYRVRNMNGTWWMIQNADKPLNGDYCTNNSINISGYGHLYSGDCAQMACPDGWTLPSDEDFKKLAKWLSANNKWWDEWNSDFALAGDGYLDNYDSQGLYGGWWSSNSSDRCWYVNGGNMSGRFYAYDSDYLLTVRCRKYQ